VAGFGSSPFGNAPFGADPVVPIRSRGAAPLASAKFFDLQTRTFPLDASGQFVAAHWLDQWVALQLAIAIGTIPAIPSHGHTLGRIRHITAQHTVRVTSAIRRCLRPMVDRNVLTITEISVIVKDYSTFVVLDYRNELTSKQKREEVPFA